MNFFFFLTTIIHFPNIIIGQKDQDQKGYDVRNMLIW